MDFKSLLIHLIVLALLVVVILNSIAFVSVWRLDVFVHDDLYDFGLIISFDWANDYWYNARLLWTFIVGTVALAVASIIPQYMRSQKHYKTTKILGFLLPTLASICQGISIFFLWQINSIVKNRLFEFGVPPNFDWNVLYNPLSEKALIFMSISLGILLISIVIILFFLGLLTNLNPRLTPSNLRNYLKTKKASWYWMILILAITTTVIVFSVPEDFYPIVYLRYVFGAMFIFWLPGYSVIKALFVNRNPTEIKNSVDFVENIGLVLSSNLAIVPITGLIINYLLGGIGFESITIGLLVITLVFATLAFIRECQTEFELS